MNDIPAFPRPYSHDDYLEDIDYLAQDGMTLRDYFAAKAMQGMLSENSGIRYPTDELAKFAYAVADEMMKAREE
jgi:hypothetical protein